MLDAGYIHEKGAETLEALEPGSLAGRHHVGASLSAVLLTVTPRPSTWVVGSTIVRYGEAIGARRIALHL